MIPKPHGHSREPSTAIQWEKRASQSRLPAAFSHVDATLGKEGWHPLRLEGALIYFLKEWNLTLFFFQEAFPEEGDMFMPTSNIVVYWQPELASEMEWHFQLLSHPDGIKNPTAHTSKKYPNYQDADHLGTNWRADLPTALEVGCTSRILTLQLTLHSLEKRETGFCLLFPMFPTQ